MKTQHLTAAEWIYLENPLLAWPHKFIAYTLLELLFLGVLKLETRRAPHYGPPDPRAGGVMHFLDIGPYVNKFHYYRHQAIFIKHIELNGESSLGNMMKRVRSRLGGENGSQIIEYFIIPLLQDRKVLWTPYSGVHLAQIHLSYLNRRVRLMKKSLKSLDLHDLEQSSRHLTLSDFGPLLLFEECKIAQQIKGQNMRFKLQKNRAFYDFRLKEEVGEMEVFFPDFPIHRLMRVCKRYFPPVYIEPDFDINY